ncbi:Unknown protein sequence [Pseudomonas amygdali pv. eriobotryae]|uniref:Uncharacterized protein n=1 Tax=Pseudomonas amygdali pv. eriobotryae TaxID=129137 RepID=A0A0P9Q1J1_PSEA0|nr:Unknown protein sequence [Pseudomonas amygdali pv. eriobotryae]
MRVEHGGGRRKRLGRQSAVIIGVIAAQGWQKGVVGIGPLMTGHDGLDRQSGTAQQHVRRGHVVNFDQRRAYACAVRCDGLLQRLLITALADTVQAIPILTLCIEASAQICDGTSGRAAVAIPELGGGGEDLSSERQQRQHGKRLTDERHEDTHENSVPFNTACV